MWYVVVAVIFSVLGFLGGDTHATTRVAKHICLWITNGEFKLHGTVYRIEKDEDDKR